MNAELRRKLLEADYEGNWEHPPGFDWPARINEIKALRPELERIIGLPLEIDENVQDASFLTDLFILEEGAKNIHTGVITYCFRFAVRFSNFGRFATIHNSTGQELRNEFPIIEVENFLGSKGFVVLPAEALEAATYDGKNEPYEERLTWWIRYFDYL